MSKSSLKKKKQDELLVQSHLIDKQRLSEIQQKVGKNNPKMLSVLLDQGLISESEMVDFLSNQYGYQVIEIEKFDISKEVINLIPKKICEKFNVIPISRLGDTLVVAVSNPSDQTIKEQLLFISGCKIEFVLAELSSIQNAIGTHYEDVLEDIHKLFVEIEESNIKFQKKSGGTPDEDENENVGVINLDLNDPEPVVRFVNRMIKMAKNKKASDIHIESYEKKFRVRFRIDGKLHEIFHPPKNISSYIINRMKVLSRLDIGEKRKPQDGRLKVHLKRGKTLNFRVSTAPTVGGEKIVLRILDDAAVSVGFEELGMTEKEVKVFHEALHQPQGLILITGPTGSGKTTTIYSGLKLLNTVDRNISTAEDPVEYKIEGLNQVQVHTKIGLNFSNALRAFLRQDPDVILIGEIRDYETAEIAFKAAATGHLVVSTVHTNDTPSTITRLLDIGIPDYSIAENTSLVIGQRLLRKICVKCRTTDYVSKNSLAMLGLSKGQIEKSYGNIQKGAGCRICSGIGYKGRTAVYEMLKVTDKVKRGVFKKMAPLDLKQMMIKEGELKTLRQSGIDKMIQGVTSFEEVLYGTRGDKQ